MIRDHVCYCLGFLGIPLNQYTPSRTATKRQKIRYNAA